MVPLREKWFLGGKLWAGVGFMRMGGRYKKRWLIVPSGRIQRIYEWVVKSEVGARSYCKGQRRKEKDKKKASGAATRSNWRTYALEK